ncbi:UMP-CMP kinase 2, mitochondrial-like [Atheta coriaria]|uniref:UMP-CMP kinase 2, mitochondrial-like n=1 Tax=Dalotia coriaria TaxID=877792 RepID=UPI0031F3EBFA
MIIRWIASPLLVCARFVLPHLSKVARSPSLVLYRCFTFKQMYNLETMTSHVMYPTLKSVLEVFQDEKYKADDNVSKLLKIYADAESNAKPVAKNHPLIVLEGLDLSGKSTLSRLLAKKINAVNLKSPPSCISSELRAAFDDSADLKTAFYALGNYIAAFEIAKTLETQPVVLDRFWNSTAANALARNVQAKPGGYDLPARGNPVYRWPADLIQPDVVLFLSVSEHERQRRQARRKEVTKEEMMLKEIHSFRQNVLLAYQYMEEPAIQMVNSDVSVAETLDGILKSIAHIIKI